MGDNDKELKQEEQKQPEELIQMTITFHPSTGQIQVVGPKHGIMDFVKKR